MFAPKYFDYTNHKLITNLSSHFCSLALARVRNLSAEYDGATNNILTIACSILLSIATALAPVALQINEKQIIIHGN
jgi:hypothetical protein